MIVLAAAALNCALEPTRIRDRLANACVVTEMHHFDDVAEPSNMKLPDVSEIRRAGAYTFHCSDVCMVSGR